jgi:probable HAF family extracellular repeat protein
MELSAIQPTRPIARRAARHFKDSNLKPCFGNQTARSVSSLHSRGTPLATHSGTTILPRWSGSSGTCSNTAHPPVNPDGRHALLWEADGSPIDLGNLGGTTGNIASSINEWGEVVGTSQSSKDNNIHAFLWTKATGMQDYGLFPGSVATVPPCCNTINNRGEMVGFAIDPTGNSRALVWQGKTPMDLNDFIPQDSPLYLQASETVNDAGEIAGTAIVKSSCPPASPPNWLVNQTLCTEVHGFLATPSYR